MDYVWRQKLCKIEMHSRHTTVVLLYYFTYKYVKNRLLYTARIIDLYPPTL